MRRTPIGRVAGAAIQIVAALAVTAALLGLIEWGCGFLAPPEKVLQTDSADYVAQALKVLELAPDLNPSPLIVDPQLLWRNKPGAQKTQHVNPQRAGSEEWWSIAIDREGYRGPEVGPKAPGVYRVLCIGDSITFGFNVEQGASYPRQLEEGLRAAYPGRAFEVINAGVPGWSWVQGYQFLVTKGLALAPDVVVMAHGTNDQFFLAQVTDRESIAQRTNWAARRLGWLQPFLERTNTYRALARYAPRLRARLEASPGCQAQIQASGHCRRVGVAEIAETVEASRRVTAEAGIDLIVLNVDFMETSAVQGSRRASNAAGIPFLDMVARFHALRAADAQARAERLHLAPARTAGATPPTPAQAVLRVEAAGEGRISVRGTAYLFGHFDFDEPLHDDGSHGDEVGGDHVYTTTLSVPGGVAALEYKFYRDGEPEFVPLPPLPSSTGYRLLRLAGDTVGPIEMFAQLERMAERTHPNAEGQRVIAAAVQAAIEALPSFQRGAPAAAVTR